MRKCKKILALFLVVICVMLTAAPALAVDRDTFQYLGVTYEYFIDSQGKYHCNGQTFNDYTEMLDAVEAAANEGIIGSSGSSASTPSGSISVLVGGTNENPTFIISGNKVHSSLTTSLNTGTNKVLTVCRWVLSLFTIAALGIFVISITKLATSASSPGDRKKAMSSIMYSGIGLALFGSLTLFVSFFWTFLT